MEHDDPLGMMAGLRAIQNSKPKPRYVVRKGSLRWQVIDTRNGTIVSVWPNEQKARANARQKNAT